MKPLFISMYCPNCDNNNNKIYYGFIPVWKKQFDSIYKNYKYFSVVSVVLSTKELTQKFLLKQYPRNKAEDFYIVKVSSSNPILYTDNLIENIKYGDIEENKYIVDSRLTPRSNKELNFVSYE
jgi:hypothetical protein